VKATALPSSPKIIEGLRGKGWIEQRGDGNDLCYRITDKGLAVKMAPLRIYY
jgi:predicted transcriptional regulator